MKRVLYILNDCMRKFTYERTAGMHRAIRRMEEPVNLYIVRSDGYFEFASEHNRGEYNIYRLPDYRDFDGIILDVNSILDADADSDSYTRGVLYTVREAAASGKPVVSMANDIDGFHYVGIDNYSAMKSVIRYLHQEMGLTDFWFAMGPADNYENQARTGALLDYCKDNGFPCREDRLYSESFIIESGIRAFNELITRHNGRIPQAVICANDHIALGICHAAESAGFKVPRDFFVTGFDNTDVSFSLSPSITTVDQLCWNMGDACMDVMRRIWAGEEVPGHIYTPTELVLRETTGHPAPATGDIRKQVKDYISRTSRVTDFDYKLTVLQYQLPGCRTVKEMCEALIACLSTVNCKGASLVLDHELFENGKQIEFRERMGRMRDPGDGMPVEGYSDRMERIFSWEAGKPARYGRKRVGSTLDVTDYEGPGENHLFAPIHFMEHTVGYLAIWDCLDLIRIQGVSSLVNTLTMALRAFFARRNLSYINQVLAGISMKDNLTGLYNRLGYHDLAYPLYQEVTGRGGKLAIIFIDMDGLKHINDTFGHSVGDQAIRSVAAVILRYLPKGAIPVRYGGDEFLLLMPAENEGDVRKLLDSISSALPAEAKALGVPDVVSISSGFVLTDPEDRKPLDDYVLEADGLMYDEKKKKKGKG